MEYGRGDIHFSPSDFLGVKYGIKPVSRRGLHEEIDLNHLKQICAAYSIEVEITENKIYKSQEEELYAYIGRDKEKIKSAIRAERNDDRLEAGSLLGYPECCVESFVGSISSETENLVGNTWKDAEEASYLMNSLYNFSARGDVEKVSTEQFFQRMQFLSLFYLPHHPCSLNCSRSLEMARKMKEKMQEDFPEFEKRLRNSLSGSFMIIDDMNFAAFRGEKEGSELHYDRVETDYTHIEDADILDALKNGDRVVEAGGLEIYRNGRIIESTEGGTIIQFSKSL